MRTDLMNLLAIAARLIKSSVISDQMKLTLEAIIQEASNLDLELKYSHIAPPDGHNDDILRGL